MSMGRVGLVSVMSPCQKSTVPGDIMGRGGEIYVVRMFVVYNWKRPYQAKLIFTQYGEGQERDFD